LLRPGRESSAGRNGERGKTTPMAASRRSSVDPIDFMFAFYRRRRR
jgi:hypothetical protein